MVCSDCRHFMGLEPVKRCSRYPPINISSQKNWDPVYGFPEISEEDLLNACGEYKLPTP